VEFQVVDSKPLEDGEKTSRLADRLAETVTTSAEVVNEDTGEITQEPPAQEPKHRGRPPKQEPTVAKKETVQPAENYVELLQDEMRFHDESKLIAARKALDIRKLSIAEFTQDEAKAALLWLEENTEKE